jgi:hypothetical protein
MQSKNHLLRTVLNRLMQQYKKQVPDVSIITDLLLKESLINNLNEIENDHIAFRTLALPHLGIQSLEKIFLYYGYERKGSFDFKEKKLNAFWYAPPEDHFPRIFISELRVSDLSEESQAIIKSCTKEIKEDPVDLLNLDDPISTADFLQSPLWPSPFIEDYETLEQESEYASWVIYNRFYLNHFTISVHGLQAFNTLETFVPFLEKHGILINDAGGKIKTSPDKLLIQGSTVAAKEKVKFKSKSNKEKVKEIATAYVEFAERKILPEFNHLELKEIKRKHRREGFEAQNANSIFESTYTSQTKKR